MIKHTLLCLTLFLGGCAAAGAVTAAYVVGDIVSEAATEKTIDDHVVSAVRNQDCSVVRWLNGKKYCEDKVTYTPEEKPKTYCYRTLGGVDCYLEPLKNRNDYLLNP